MKGNAALMYGVCRKSLATAAPSLWTFFAEPMTSEVLDLAASAACLMVFDMVDRCVWTRAVTNTKALVHSGSTAGLFY